MKQTLISFLSLIIVLVILALAQFLSPALGPFARLVRPLAPRTTKAQGNPRTRVWVNTRSGLYYCPHSKLYGNIKPGAYLAQTDAFQRGYRAALSETCQ